MAVKHTQCVVDRCQVLALVKERRERTKEKVIKKTEKIKIRQQFRRRDRKLIKFTQKLTLKNKRNLHDKTARTMNTTKN